MAAEAWRVWNRLREEDFQDDLALGATITRVNFPARSPSDARIITLP